MGLQRFLFLMLAQPPSPAASSWPLHNVLAHISFHICRQLCNTGWLDMLVHQLLNVLVLLHCMAKFAVGGLLQ